MYICVYVYNIHVYNRCYTIYLLRNCQNILSRGLCENLYLRTTQWIAGSYFEFYIAFAAYLDYQCRKYQSSESVITSDTSIRPDVELWWWENALQEINFQSRVRRSVYLAFAPTQPVFVFVIVSACMNC